MAKDEKGGKIRFMMVEVEGSNETLQETIRAAIAGAIGRPTIPTRILGAPARSKALPGNGTEQAATLDDEEYVEVEAEEVDPSPSRPKRERVRASRVPEILDLDLVSGDISFEAFCQPKNLDSHTDRYLAIAAWLKEYRSIEAIGQEHIYTVYRFMKWPVQNDITSPLRNMMRTGQFRRADRGQYAITLVGLNDVQKMG